MRLSKSVAAGLTAVAALVLAPLVSRAATSTATLDVSATVVAACTITTSPILFGDYNPSTASENQGSFDVTCTNGTPYTYSLGGGNTAAANNARVMSGPDAAGLSYELYTDSARSAAWNVDAASASVTATGVAISVPVYGRIPAGQYRTIGLYADQVLVSVDF